MDVPLAPSSGCSAWIIQCHVRPGTIIWSNEWAAYRRVQQLPFVSTHATVNHSLEFVTPVTGVHTQQVESYWNQVKTKFKRMKGVHDTMLSSYLDEYMWRERHGQTGSTACNEQSIQGYRPEVPRLEWSLLHRLLRTESSISATYLPPSFSSFIFSSTSFSQSYQNTKGTPFSVLHSQSALYPSPCRYVYIDL